MNGSPRHCSTEGKLTGDAGKTISEEPTDNLGSIFSGRSTALRCHSDCDSQSTMIEEGRGRAVACPCISLVSDVFHVRRDPPLIAERIGHGPDPVAIGLFGRFL